MATFNAGSVAEPLDYDFTAIEGLDIKGTVKEPSDLQLEKFARAVAGEEMRFLKLRPDISDDPSPDEMLVALEKVTVEESMAYLKAMAKIYSDLCSGTPSAADLMKLPRRVRLHFFAWIRDEVANPEAGAGDGSGQAESLA